MSRSLIDSVTAVRLRGQDLCKLGRKEYGVLQAVYRTRGGSWGGFFPQPTRGSGGAS